MASKRKILTLDERIKVIELCKTKSARKVAEELSVRKTQIQSILKRKIELISDFEQNLDGDRKRQRRITGNDDINDLCLKWFNDCMGRKINVSGPLLKEKALKFAKDLNKLEFKASNGWLESFIKRNNIVFGTMSGERGDVDKNIVENWKEKLPKLCEGYEPNLTGYIQYYKKMVGQTQSPWVGQKKKVFNSEMAWNITRTNLLVSNNVRYDVQEKV